MNYVLFDGQHHQKLKPLTLTRPVSDLRVGVFKIHEKWTNFLAEEVGIRSKDYLSKKFNSFDEKALCGISGALLPDEDLCSTISELEDNTIMMKDGQVLAIKPLPKEQEMESALNKYRVVKYTESIQVINRPMDIFLLNENQIDSDLNFVEADFKPADDCGEGNLIIGDQVFIENGAVLNGVTLNSNEGPIYIQKNTEIMEGSNIRGPFVLMEGSIIKPQ